MKLYIGEAPDTDDIGLADNDIDGFLKNLLASVNRECAQNSNDESEARPVKMNFDLLEVPTDEVPDIDNYRYVVKRCLEEAKSTGAKKADEFFSNAVQVLSRDKIKVLSISDEGTKGAGGEFKKGGKFFTLVVSKGRTDKDDIFSAGSFGIGKNAAFAGSELRCVFYSSRYGEKDDFYCMGKSILTSWRSNEDKNMSHKVFFVNDGTSLTPASTDEAIPEWLHKKERGLRLSVLAPRIELKEGWTHGYIASLLSNFFVAIYDEALEFSLDRGSVRLNRATMLSNFNDEQVRRAAESSGELELLTWAKYCAESFLSNEFRSEFFEVEGLGEFEVLINVREGLPKKVCIVRNGMFITDKLHKFGKPLERFPNTKDFIAIVRPRKVDDVSSGVIKRIENPEHNELTTSYIADEEEVGRLKAAMVKLEGRVRDVIKKHAKMEITSTRNIEEMREFFKKAGDDSDSSEKSNELDPAKIASLAGTTKAQSTSPVQKAGGKTGGKGQQGGLGRKRRKQRGGPGNKAGNKKKSEVSCRAVKTAGGNGWRVKFSKLPREGVLKLWPEEESRSKETRKIKIQSCSAPGATIASSGIYVSIPLTDQTPNIFSVVLERSASVVDMHPEIQEVSK